MVVDLVWVDRLDRVSACDKSGCELLAEPFRYHSVASSVDEQDGNVGSFTRMVERIAGRPIGAIGPVWTEQVDRNGGGAGDVVEARETHHPIRRDRRIRAVACEALRL